MGKERKYDLKLANPPSGSEEKDTVQSLAEDWGMLIMCLVMVSFYRSPVPYVHGIQFEYSSYLLVIE